MNLTFSDKAKKQYRKLPAKLQKKVDKQFIRLLLDRRYPSLRVKKMEGIDRFEGRIDYHYRFTFIVKHKEIIILSIGMHDQGLEKN